MNPGISIEAVPQAACIVCGSGGETLYRDLPDRLFGSPGRWGIRCCNDPHCRTLWLDPKPTPADIGKAYLNYYTHGQADARSPTKRLVRFLARELAAVRYGYASSRLPGPGKYLAVLAASLYPGLTAHLDLMVRYLPAALQGRGRLLDVGCGDGEALDILRDIGWQVSGVEFDESAVVAARQRGLEIRHGSISDARFADRSFDVVTSSHVIEHVHEPIEFLRESWRILDDGGTLVAVTPNALAWGHQRHGADWLNLDPPRHLFLATPQSLRAMALKAGFSNAQVHCTSRAVAFTETASLSLAAHDHYQWGAPQGLSTWARAQARQVIESLRLRPDSTQGNELVLTAHKQRA